MRMSKRKSMSISTLPVECPAFCRLCQSGAGGSRRVNRTTKGEASFGLRNSTGRPSIELLMSAIQKPIWIDRLTGNTVNMSQQC